MRPGNALARCGVAFAGVMIARFGDRRGRVGRSAAHAAPAP